jgi:drug/metabolite transporter (DMT)-like permease
LSASTAGVLLGFLAYGLFTVADAAVKAIGPALDIFQIGFLVMVFATPVMLAAKPASESWRAVLRPRRPGLVLLRGLLTTISGVCVVIAFTTIPFAEAFALLFLAPTIGTLLSRLLLKEPLDWHTMLAIGLGLAGVLIAIRPGLRVLEAGHLAAFVAAFSVGAGVSVLRKLSTTEPRTTLFMVVALSILAVNGVLMLRGWRWPDPREWSLLALSGVLDGIGHVALLLAARRTLAARIGATHYSQLIWAVLIGMLVFDEYPDRWMIAGLAIIALSGTLALVAARRRPG